MSLRQWLLVLAYGASTAATQVVWVTYAVATSAAADHLGVTEAAAGRLTLISPVLYVLVAAPTGLLLDRWFRPVLIAGMVLTLVGALVRLDADSYTWAVIGQVLAGVSQPAVQIAITPLCARFLREKDQPVGVAVGSAATFGGLLLTFVLGGFFPDAGDLPRLVQTVAVITLVPTVLLVVMLRLTPQVAAPRAEAAPSLRRAFGDPMVRALTLVVFAPFGIFIALTSWLGVLLDDAGVSTSQSDAMLAAAVISGVLGTLVLPVWAARHRREFTMLWVAIGIGGLGGVLLAVWPGVIGGFTALILIGLLQLPTMAVVLDLVNKVAGELAGTASGLIWLSGNLGGAVVSGLVGAASGSPALAFGVLVLAAASAVPPMRMLARAARREVPAALH